MTANSFIANSCKNCQVMCCKWNYNCKVCDSSVSNGITVAKSLLIHESVVNGNTVAKCLLIHLLQVELQLQSVWVHLLQMELQLQNVLIQL